MEFWLHHGVIRLSDVKWRSCATTHYPAGMFKQPLETMEEAWTGIEGGKALAKLACNSLIGLWCIDDMHVYKVSSSRWERDKPEGALQGAFVYESGGI